VNVLCTVAVNSNSGCLDHLDKISPLVVRNFHAIFQRQKHLWWLFVFPEDLECAVPNLRSVWTQVDTGLWFEAGKFHDSALLFVRVFGDFSAGAGVGFCEGVAAGCFTVKTG